VYEAKIQGVDTQVSDVVIEKTDANTITVHNPARARRRGSEKIPKLKIGNHMIGQFKEKSKTLVLVLQLSEIQCVIETQRNLPG
jgi:hypothetical protein